MKKQNFSNIIIRMPNWLGDMVMATPCLENIRHAYPNAQITAMCLSSTASLLQNHLALNDIFKFDKPKGLLRRLEQPQIIESLKQGQFDLGILLPNSFSSAWWFYRGEVQNRVGFACNGRSLLLSKSIPFPKERLSQHLVHTYLELLKPLGIHSKTTKPTLYLTNQEKIDVRIRLKNYQIPDDAIVIGINPGAAYGSAKCWPASRFRQVTQGLIANKNIYVLFFGDQNTAPLVEEICSGIMNAQVINLAKQTSLRELMGLLWACDIVLSNDSGPMHIAAALQTPLVALFGSTDENVTGPYQHGIVMRKKVDCAPCFKRECPIDFRCMKGITVDTVLVQLWKMVESLTSPPRRFSA